MTSKRSVSHPSKSKNKPVPTNLSPPQSPNPKSKNKPSPIPAPKSSKMPPNPDAPAKKQRNRKAKESPDEEDSPSASEPPAATSPRKSQRKRKPREFPDEETSRRRRQMTDGDAVLLLKSVLQFRVQTGATPTPSTIGLFYDFAKSSLPPHINPDQVYNKIRHLRQKFHHAAAHGPHDTSFYNVAVEVWGAEGWNANGAVLEDNQPAETKEETGDEKNDDDDDDDDNFQGGNGAGSYLIGRSNLVYYCREKGLSEELLEMGLELLGPAKAKTLEGKWCRQLETNMKIQAKRCVLNKELFLMLGEIYKA